MVDAAAASDGSAVNAGPAGGSASEGETGAGDGRYQPIDVVLIDVPAMQPRRFVHDAGLADLAASIAVHGVLQPIRVRPRSGRYELIAGQRRVLACRRLGVRSIPAIVVDVDDDRGMIEALVENVQREDLNVVDRGEALRRLRVNLGAQSWEEVGRAIGISRRRVYHLLNVGELPDAIREDVRAGIVNEKHARALRRLRRQPELQTRLWQRITAEGLSGDSAMQAAGALLSDAAPDRDAANGLRTPLSSAVDDLLRQLRAASMRDVRPLRQRLEQLSEQLSELLSDAFGAA